MLARAALAVLTLSCWAAPLLAQVEPILVEAPAFMSSLNPPGTFQPNDLSIVRTSQTSAFVGVTRRVSMGSAYSGSAWDYDLTTQTMTPRNDFNGIDAFMQEVSILDSLCEVLVFRQGIGARYGDRAGVGAIWNLRTINNLPATQYGLEWCRIGGADCVAACSGAPNPRLTIHQFDRTSATVFNPVDLVVPVGGPNNFPAFAIPLNDENGDTRGFLVCIRSLVGFHNQFVFCDGTDPASQWSVLHNSTNTAYTGGAQMWGGQFLAISGILPGIGMPGPYTMTGAFTCETRVSAAGGAAGLTSMGRPGDIGVVGIAGALSAPIVLPGFSNRLGLDTLTISATVAYYMPEGCGRHQFQMPATIPGWWPIQSATLSLSGSEHAFGNTSVVIAF